VCFQGSLYHLLNLVLKSDDCLLSEREYQLRVQPKRRMVALLQGHKEVDRGIADRNTVLNV
jgi:hypothetical protein